MTEHQTIEGDRTLGLEETRGHLEAVVPRLHQAADSDARAAELVRLTSMHAGLDAQVSGLIGTANKDWAPVTAEIHEVLAHSGA